MQTCSRADDNHRAPRIVTRYHFSLGKIVITHHLDHAIRQQLEFAQWVHECLHRHAKGDWGDLSDTSKQLNDAGLSTENPRHIHSSYKLPEKLSELIGQTKLWIMTEHDRSATTLLFPSDY